MKHLRSLCVSCSGCETDLSLNASWAKGKVDRSLKLCPRRTRTSPRLATTWENRQWQLVKSFCSVRLQILIEWSIITTSICILLGPASAQDKALNGPSLESAKEFLSPLANLTAYLIYAVAIVWKYIADHGPVAVLLSATIATFVAINSIKTTRSVTRLRETFNTLNQANWDRDMIEARKVYANLLTGISDNPQLIAQYCRTNEKPKSDAKNLYGIYARDEKVDIAETLMTILNEYEILSLGVRMDIVDEIFLFKSLRSTTLRDWKNLSPLISEYRRRYANNLIYIEFEGLANAWEKNRSYATGKEMKLTKKYQHFS